MAVTENGGQCPDGQRSVSVSLSVNGSPVRVEVETRDTLAWVLRDRLGLTGTKIGCDVQVCGACTVLVDGAPVSSCTILFWQVEGKEVTTIEGVADGSQLDPIQTSFIEHGGLQCGFCTPGMVLATRALLAENPAPNSREVRDYLGGNLCRCTGYQLIVESVLAARARLAP
jgi:aerobic carbon-monoxide dehydrogenase small subunit